MRAKDIDLMREIRLWIVQIGLPIAGMIAVAKNPDIVKSVKDGVTDIVKSIKRGL